MSRGSLKNVSRLIELANKEVPINESFLADYKRSVELDANKYDGIPSQTFKPSGMNCKRGCYYQIVGVKPDTETASFNMVGICDSGTDIHVRTQTAIMGMKENGIDCEWIDVEQYIKEHNLDYLIVREKKGTETKLYDTRYGTYISFMCDGIIKYKGKYYIIEIKTESSNKWYSRTDVDKKHYHQAISYANSFNIDDVLFIYRERDLLNTKCYLFHVTREMKNDLVAFIEDVQGYVDRKITPPKEDLPTINCKYCGYLNHCKGDK